MHRWRRDAWTPFLQRADAPGGRSTRGRSARSRMIQGAVIGLTTVAAAAMSLAAPAAASSGIRPFVRPFAKVSVVGSTVPANGDVNPYGVAVVPRSVGHLRKGDVLVSNFNDAQNLQGTGKTIVELSPSGHRSLFAAPSLGAGRRCPGGVGLTTALAVFRSGWVVAGSLPTSNGMADTARRGCLIVISPTGRVAATIRGPLVNGPWDLASVDHGRTGTLFVSNVLNGTVAADGAVVDKGTVVRINLTLPRPGHGVPTVTAETVIGSGFAEQTSTSALVVGPTGLGLTPSGTLYVADTLENRVTAIPDALRRETSAFTGRDVTSGGALNGPLGLSVAPDGDILTVNAGDGNLVETTPGGAQIAVRTLDTSGSPAGSGALFGLVVAPHHQGVYFVDDATNTLDLLGRR